MSIREGISVVFVIMMIAVLQGCHVMAGKGESASGIFAPSDNALQKSVARDFGVSPEDVAISNRDVAGFPGSNTTYFSASIRGQKRNCYVTSTLFLMSSPLCAKPGESISSGDNALTRAAGRN